MRLLVMGFLFALGCIVSPVAAQDHPVPVPTWTEEQRNVFDENHIIYGERALFGTQFYLNGREIEGGKAMEDLLASAEDEETLRQWRSGENDGSWGWILMGTGSGAVVAGGILSWQDSGNTTLGNVLVLTGLSVDLVGGLLWRIAQSEQLSAVDRYNAIVRQENGFSLLDIRSQGAELAWVENF